MARNVTLFFFIFLTSLAFTNPSENISVSGDSGSKNEKFNPGEMIMHHIIDSHEWHILDWKEHSISIPLPIIIFHEGKGLKSFMSSKFNHGKTSYLGYKMDHGKIVAIDSSGSINKEETQKLWDFSITKNVFSLFFSIIIMLIVFLRISKIYIRNANQTPRGLQGFLEIMILFVRDDIAKPSIGNKHYKKIYALSVNSILFYLAK